MSTEPVFGPDVAAVPAERPVRPVLTLILNCEFCEQRVVEVRGRDGRTIRLLADDAGKAIRDPDGELWAARLDGRWRVVTVEAGEDPPTSGKGARYTEHRCPKVVTTPKPASVLAADGHGSQLFVLHPYEAGVVRRPPGRGEGVYGPECPVRRRLVQVAADGGPPFQRMCFRCGRVTARSDGDLMPWCGGGLVVLADPCPPPLVQ